MLQVVSHKAILTGNEKTQESFCCGLRVTNKGRVISTMQRKGLLEFRTSSMAINDKGCIYRIPLVIGFENEGFVNLQNCSNRMMH